jgi:UPF0755 protein
MSPAWHRVFWTGLAAAGLWGLWLLADGTRPYFRSPEPVLLDIERGAGTREIARRLEDTGVIRSRWTFLALHYLRPGNTLKAGEYSFDAPATPLEVLGKLVRGDVSYEVLVIPEGYNRFEIADAVAAQGFAGREDFLWATEEASLVADLDPLATTLEGYLFPDTYHFPRHARPAQIVRSMVARFREVYASLKAPVVSAVEPPEPSRSDLSQMTREIVTMASLVEKETSRAEERPLVAAVFFNRLRRGILLQADPTVIYALVLENRYNGRLLLDHLDDPSPYNTYVHRGLPPGPIANPGRSSLAAALSPVASDYLYFVANAEGGHAFSRTLAEHNLAVSQYRRSQREQSAAGAAAR